MFTDEKKSITGKELSLLIKEAIFNIPELHQICGEKMINSKEISIRLFKNNICIDFIYSDSTTLSIVL